MEEIKFRVRNSDEVKTEKVPGGDSLKFLYGNPIGKASLWMLVKRRWFSSWFGGYMDSPKSKKRVAPFVKEHQIDLSNYVVPNDGFSSFNDFFYRKIKMEYRPIQNGVVSPADGRVLAFPKISETKKFFIKGSEFDINKFLGDSDLASCYRDGAMFIVRLAPVDYHRYHFPVSGKVGVNNKISGAYYSVSPFALRKSLRIFCENKREFSIVDSLDHGKVLICDVGATLTGGIVQSHSENSEIKKGDEKGYFKFGGSTLVLLFEKGRINFSEDLIKNTSEGFETYLKMGETIGQ